MCTFLSEPEFPFIVASPQCPLDSNWIQQYDTVIALLEIMTKYPVDSERVYLTGFSMGGQGAWDFASRSSKLFSAVVPISGWYDPEKAREQFAAELLPVKWTVEII
ncbi:dienelactone hydrolase family protein [Paenibacillus chartarius]|uniref:Dienelactone hydrolase family protein n=1 Tax=Paenibacillus chartarius TaxID=747481 RepID=A0ABV6DI63_9BACL